MTRMVIIYDLLIYDLRLMGRIHNLTAKLQFFMRKAVDFSFFITNFAPNKLKSR
jgi:hypothetical protein